MMNVHGYYRKLSFVFSLVFCLVIASFSQIHWVQRNSLPTHQDLTDITTAGNLVVAVGVSGTIIVSNDSGQSWQSISTNTLCNLYSVAWTGTHIVAVGDSCIEFISTDGTNWQRKIAFDPPYFQNGNVHRCALKDVTWTGNFLAAAGYYYDSFHIYLPYEDILLVSKDGISWSYKDPAPGRSPSGQLSYETSWDCLTTISGAGTMIIGTASKGRARILPHGDSLLTTKVLLPMQSFRSIYHCDTQFVALNGTDSICFSSDGWNWTQTPMKLNTLFNTVYWANKHFYCVGPEGKISFSEDGISWQLIDSPTAEELEAVTAIGTKLIAVGRKGTIISSTDEKSWKQPGSEPVNTLNSVIWTGEKYVAVGQKGTIITSKTGGAWEQQKSNVLTSLSDIIRADSILVAVGDSGTILISKDGLNWTVQRYELLNSLNSACWDGTYFHVLGRGSSGGLHDTTFLLTSRDCQHWQRYNFCSLPDCGEILFSVSSFKKDLFFTGKDRNSNAMIGYGTIDSSSHFKLAGTFFATDMLSLENAAATDQMLVAVGLAGTTVAMEVNLTGGINSFPYRAKWKKTDALWNLHDVVWSGKQFVAVGENICVISEDGVNWEKRTLPMACNLKSIAFHDGLFVAVGVDGIVISSPEEFKVKNRPVSSVPIYTNDIRISRSGEFISVKLLNVSKYYVTSVCVFNMAGQCIKTYRITTASSIMISTEDLPAGLYCIKIGNGNYYKTGSFLVNR